MSELPGEILLSLCQNASNDVFLAAPFIKKDTLQKILAVIPVEIERLTVVTRWVPSEIALGVSDLEVFDLLDKSNAQLLLHPCLHAKYYRVDNRCLIGSANIRQLEVQLINQAIAATKFIVNALQREVNEFKKKFPGQVTTIEDQGAHINHNHQVWLPVCNRPDYLYRIYTSHDTSDLLISVVNAGKEDLYMLNVLPGLTEINFKKYIAAIFEHIPIVKEIHSLSKGSGITSDAAKGVITKYRAQISDPIYDSETYWQIFKTWLIYFFPKRYRIRSETEVLEQAREI